MTWRAAKSLIVFHNQTRPLAPGADPRSFGLKGDDRHESTSDHSPHDFAGWGDDIVTAGDIPKFGNLNPRQVLNNIRLSRDPRVKYAISERQMFSSYPARGYPAWTWRPYPLADDDPHEDHGHLSVVGDRRADDERPWQISTGWSGDDDMKYNEHQKLDAIYNLYPTVKLDTGKADDGSGPLRDFEVPFTKAFQRLQADVAELVQIVKGASNG